MLKVVVDIHVVTSTLSCGKAALILWVPSALGYKASMLFVMIADCAHVSILSNWKPIGNQRVPHLTLCSVTVCNRPKKLYRRQFNQFFSTDFCPKFTMSAPLYVYNNLAAELFRTLFRTFAIPKVSLLRMFAIQNVRYFEKQIKTLNKKINKKELNKDINTSTN